MIFRALMMELLIAKAKTTQSGVLRHYLRFVTS